MAGIAAAAVAALFAGWWAVKLTAAQEIARVNPFAAAAVAPGDPRVKMRLAFAEMVLSPKRADPAHRAAAIDALDRSALAEQPFLLAAAQAQAAGDGARSERLLLESRRRNPRDRMTRLMLVDRYLTTERWQQAGDEIAVASRLIPKAQDLLAPALSKLAGNPHYTAPMSQILASNPALKDAVLDQLARGGTGTAQILRLAGASIARPAGWQQTLLERQVNAGDVRGAFGLWTRFTRLPAAPAKAIYDPGFAGMSGAPPFNWDFPAGEAGHAEKSRGGLQVDYYGRLDTNLARQLMMLAPGRYRFVFRADGNAKGDGGQLRWTIACAKGGAELLRLPIKDVTSPRRFAGEFAVPSGCDGQWLTLGGVAGDVATEQSALISALEVVPAGGR